METTLTQVVDRAVQRLRAISHEEASVKPAPNKWSKKEILGHLIDSATNNHQRFIRLQMSREVSLPGYDQDGWVKANGYQQTSWSDVVTLWASYNLHLAAVIENIDPTCAEHIWHHPEADYKLKFLVDDYVVHMLHHLAQIGVA
jgi:DinB superfamily